MSKLTVTDAFERFYLEHAYSLRHSTRKTMECYLRTWEGLADSPDVREITTATFADVKQTLVAAGIANASINSMIRTVVTILRHCGPPADGCPHGRGIIRSVPYAGRKLPERRGPKWIPTLEQLSAFYDAADVAVWPKGHVTPGTFWRCWLVAAYNTGLRRRDLFALEWDSVDFGQRTITVVCEKTLKIQALPINDTLERHLRIMAGDPDRVFPAGNSNRQIAREMKSISETAGIKPHITPQAVRRRAGTSFEVAKPNAGQILLGHMTKNVSFLHYVNAGEYLRDAADELPQPQSFVDGPKAFRTVPRKHERPIAAPIAVTDSRNWRFPEGDNQFVFRGVGFRMQGRALALLRLLVESKTGVDRDAIRETVYADFPDVSENTINGELSFLRERLRELFELPETLNPVPGRGGRWFLALPDVRPEPPKTKAPAKHAINPFRESDWRIAGRRISYRGTVFRADPRIVPTLQTLIDSGGVAALSYVRASELRRLLRSALEIPADHDPLPRGHNGHYTLDVP